MIYCKVCGAQLEQNARFCSQCGEMVNTENPEKRYCCSCHAELEPGALFCSVCGYRTEDIKEEMPLRKFGKILYFSGKPIKNSFSVIRPDYGGELHIYRDRMELYSEKTPALSPAVILQMQHIRYVEETKIRALSAIRLVMQDEGERYLLLWDASRSGKALLREMLNLLKEILYGT